MTRGTRSRQGLVSSLMREGSRARRAAPNPSAHPEALMSRPDRSTTLLVMDVQEGIANNFDDAALAPIVQALAAARDAGIPVVFVRVAFRAGHPEVSPDNRMFSALSERGGLLEAATTIDPRVAPRDDEPLVTKRRVSAFAGSDLDVVLRARGAKTLVLCGISTSGVVLSTLRAASDLDFDMVVLGDACLDGDEEVHRVLTEKVFPRQAEVLDVATWAQRLSA
jgi:nicotinamidase-related amidase